MKILVIDDHSLFAEGIKLVLNKLCSNVQVDTCNTCGDAINRISQDYNYDIVTLDLYMPDMDGFQALQRITDIIPSCPVVVVSSSQDIVHIRKSIDLGAKGYVLKTSSPTLMLSALKLVLEGGVYVPAETLHLEPNKVTDITKIHRDSSWNDSMNYALTPRQTEVLNLLVQGNANKDIAKILNCTESTVKAHVTVVLKALGVSNRTEATWVVEKIGLHT